MMRAEAWLSKVDPQLHPWVQGGGEETRLVYVLPALPDSAEGRPALDARFRTEPGRAVAILRTAQLWDAAPAYQEISETPGARMLPATGGSVVVNLEATASAIRTLARSPRVCQVMSAHPRLT